MIVLASLAVGISALLATLMSCTSGTLSDSLTLEEYRAAHPQAAFGTLRVSERVALLVVRSGDVQIGLVGEAGVMPVPAGKWHVVSWELAAKDGSTASWSAKSQPTRSGPSFSVAEGVETALALAEPLKATALAGKQGVQHIFSQRLEGAAGEDVTLLKNGRAAPAPKLRITNADGSYDREFQFAYG